MKLGVTVTVVLVAMAAAGVAPAGGDKPKYTIAEVMKLAQTSGLAKDVTLGKVGKKQAEELLGYYQELGKNKPPRGGGAEWAKNVESMVKAAQAAVDGDPKAEKMLKATAMNCSGCHKKHK